MSAGFGQSGRSVRRKVDGRGMIGDGKRLAACAKGAFGVKAFRAAKLKGRLGGRQKSSASGRGFFWGFTAFGQKGPAINL